jgi:hypothetical protein
MKKRLLKIVLAILIAHTLRNGETVATPQLEITAYVPIF